MIEYEAMCGQGSYQLFQFYQISNFSGSPSPSSSQLSQKIDWGWEENGVLVWQLM